MSSVIGTIRSHKILPDCSLGCSLHSAGLWTRGVGFRRGGLGFGAYGFGFRNYKLLSFASCAQTLKPYGVRRLEFQARALSQCKHDLLSFLALA